jgi:AraC-like DNA-binding protein/mannose-6-phosphate isomerase-like protein (cupin superfamily)
MLVSDDLILLIPLPHFIDHRRRIYYHLGTWRYLIMAKMENLESLPMTLVESLLKEAMERQEEYDGRILSYEELTDYVAGLIESYGRQHGRATEEMLPYFTPGNEMTRLAGEIVIAPDSRRARAALLKAMAVQDDESFLPSGKDISVGRMLRYYPAHWHSATYFQVYYAFSGNCPVHFQNEVVTLPPGGVLIAAPGVVHATPCYKDDAVLAFYMIRAATFRRVFWNQLGDGNLLSRFFRIALEGEKPASYLYFDTGEDPEVRHTLLQVYKEYQLDEPYSSQMVNALMRLFFLLILRRYEGTARLPRTDHFFWKHQFSAILSYIQSHYQEATLADMAERFSYSPKQVGRIVKTCTGQSFGNLVRGLKMKKAAELLLDRQYPPEEVAPLTGFATLSSFYRSFRDYYGLPPKEWLARQKAESASGHPLPHQ